MYSRCIKIIYPYVYATNSTNIVKLYDILLFIII